LGDFVGEGVESEQGHSDEFIPLLLMHVPPKGHLQIYCVSPTHDKFDSGQLTEFAQFLASCEHIIV
jgi:hypothetical protein